MAGKIHPRKQPNVAFEGKSDGSVTAYLCPY